MQFFPEIPLEESSARAILRGLYTLARSDGLHPKEQELVLAMAKELEVSTLMPIRPPELAEALKTPDQRLLFAKMALLMAHVEGGVGTVERALLQNFFQVLELKEGDSLGLELSVTEELLELQKGPS